MKKLAVFVFATLLIGSIAKSSAQTAISMKNEVVKPTIYSYKVKTIDGKVFDFAKLRGKKIIIVNTASECGLTPQYAQLEELYSQFKDRNVVIIGFPANNFGNQEPGSNIEIATFCQKNYGVTFPMMEKISVSGKDIAPIYEFLTQKSKNGVMDSEVQWNFQKYLINEKGEFVKMVDPKVLPNDPSIISWIKA